LRTATGSLRVGAVVLLAGILGVAGCGGGSGAAAPTPQAPSAAGQSGSSTQASGGAVPKGGVVAVGGMFPLTGPSAQIGTLQEEGAQMAIDQINAAGGVHGWKLKLDAVDHKGTAQGGALAMNQLVNLDHVPYVISGFASVLLAAQPIAAQNHVILVNTGGAGSQLVNKPWLYNIAPNPGLLDPDLASYARNTMRVSKVAMLYSDDAYGHDNAAAFKAAWQKLGGTIVADQTFQLGDSNFTDQLTKIKAVHPDAIFAVSVGDATGLAVKQARGLGITVPFLEPLGNAVVTHQVAGNLANGVICANPDVNLKTTDPGARTFIDSFRAKYHINVDASEGDAYNGMRLVAQLIGDAAAAGKDPRVGANLLAALQAHPQAHDYLDGGTIYILPNHDDVQPVAIQKIEGLNLVNQQVFPAKAPSTTA
jgi:branched-chain amino acid transport system substrate-binding protein